MIALKAVSKTFAAKVALAPLTLRFATGQTHVLLGSSGSGKSTLLRMIMGLLQPDQGTIEIDGVAMTRAARRELVLKIGYVTQDGGLFPHLAAGDNVTLVAKTLGWDKVRRQTRVELLAKLVELDPVTLGRYPRQLSGGQQQRVGLMRALMLDPAILVLDEPLGALDPIVRSGLQHELKRVFNAVQKTVLLVTHDMGEAAFFGHSITLFSEGHMIQHGTFADLVERPATPFVREFINAQRPPPELQGLK